MKMLAGCGLNLKSGGYSMFARRRKRNVFWGIILTAHLLIFSVGGSAIENEVGTVDSENVIININDGNCKEWQQIQPLIEEKNIDVGERDLVHYNCFWAVKAKNNFIFYFSYRCSDPIDWTANAWRYNIFIDSDCDKKTGFRGFESSWSIGADYMIQGSNIYKFAGSGPTAWEWKELYTLPYTLDGNQVEIQLSKKIIDSKRIEILLQGDNEDIKDYMPDDYKNQSISFELE